jgi:hypothetical protein
LIKKYQFKPDVRKLIESKIKLDSRDMNFYKKAKSISKEYPFFSKWEAEIPILHENNESIILVIILAESFARGTSYSLKVTFDKNSGDIVEKHDGFYKIPKLMQ